jgi:hypothetical protein
MYLIIKLVTCDSNSKVNMSNSGSKHKSLSPIVKKFITNEIPNLSSNEDTNQEHSDRDIPIIGWTIRKKFKNHLLYKMDWKRICSRMGVGMTKIIADYLDDINYSPESFYSENDKIMILENLKIQVYHKPELKFKNTDFLDYILIELNKLNCK